MIDFIQPYISRIVGAGVGALCAWLSVHFGLALSGQDQATLTGGGVIVVMTVFQIVYAITHRTVSKVTNPDDAAVTR